jgi:ABC-2 type transport system permease protein
MKTLLILTVANVKSLVRDRAALFWTIFFPVMFVFLFGWIFGGSGDSKISVGFVDQDGSVASAGVKTAFDQVSLLSLQVGSLDDEKAAMQKGDVSAVIVVPKGLQTAVAAKSPVAIQLYTDPAKSQTAQVISGATAQIVNGFNLALAGG